MPLSDDTSNASIFLDAVRSVAGDEGVAAIQAVRGGSEISVPRRVTPGHWLAKALGFDVAVKLCAALSVTNAEGRSIGSLRVFCPLGQGGSFRKTWRDKRSQAEELLKKGMIRADVSSQVGVGSRTVARWRAELKAAGKLPRTASPKARP